MSTQKGTATAPTEQQQYQVTLMQMLSGALVQQALYVAAKLGIADLLVGGPRTAAELAHRTKTNRGALYRVLRTLASLGVFHETEGQRFRLA